MKNPINYVSGPRRLPADVTNAITLLADLGLSVDNVKKEARGEYYIRFGIWSGNEWLDGLIWLRSKRFLYRFEITLGDFDQTPDCHPKRILFESGLNRNLISAFRKLAASQICIAHQKFALDEAKYYEK